MALVTGAAKRLGREIALGLAQAGYDVAVHYNRSQAEALASCTEIRALGRRAVAIRADLEQAGECANLVNRVHAELGSVTCLVNNAARFEFDTPSQFSAERLESHQRANLTAPLLLARQMHESVLAQPRDAVVINLLDQKLENLNADFFSYTLTKAALLAATKMMAMAFAPRLRVNGVSPGATLRSWEQSQEGFDQAHQIALLDHSSRPEDIVAAVVYLAGAAAVTGVNLVVDGGQHLMGLRRDVMFLSERL